MILDAHASLEAFLRTHALSASGVAVAFDVPGKAWATARKAPTVNCFLYDVRENTLVKHAGSQPVRDASGRVVASRPVPRYLDHCYLVSAWAGDVAGEHRLLSAVLGALLVHDTLPRAVLRGALAQQPRHVVLSVAQGSKRGMLLSLAGEQRLAIELELAVPWSGGPDEVAEHAVEQLPRIVVTQRAPGEPRLHRRAAPAQVVPAPEVPAPDVPAAAAPAPAPAPPDRLAASLLAPVAVRLLAQLQADGVPPRTAAQIGAQAGARVAALLEAGPGGAVRSPQAPPSPLQAQAARIGAAAGGQLLARLRTAVEAAAAGGPAPTAEAAARLGASVGVALAAAVVTAAGGPSQPTA